MGVVRRAMDHEREVEVAVKSLKHLDGESVLRFKREFRSLADITHRNLIELGELFEEDGELFFSMELVEGRRLDAFVRGDAGPLADIDTGDVTETAGPATAPATSGARGGDEAIVRTRPAFDEGRLRTALPQLTHALSALHAAGKVHRDVKPSNVLVTDEGRVVVLDFGVVAELGAGFDLDDSVVVGTLMYIAPEQIERATVSPASDWYALGVVLYEVLTNARPFSGEASEICDQKRWGSPRRPSELVEGLPTDLEELCLDLLGRDPEARPDGDEVLRRLGLEPEEPSVTLSAEHDMPFLGREAELRTLRERMVAAREGNTAAVLLRGESGIGKSALARHFAAEVESGGEVLVLRGRCHERESVPYKAVDGLIDRISHHLADLPFDQVEALVPDKGALLGWAFPVLRRVDSFRQRSHAARAGHDPHRVRAELFAALRELLTRLSLRAPILAIIDDLQWADADSLTLLETLLAEPDPPRLLLLATVRVADDDDVPRELSRIAGAVHELRVGPLGEETSRELAQRLGGTEGVADEIVDEAGGHPLFLDVLLRGRRIAARPDLGLEDLLRVIVERLPEEVRRTLEGIAIAGTPVPRGVIARAAKLRFAALAEHLGVLRAERLVRTGGSRRVDTVEPYHDRVCAAALTDVSAPAQAEWHRKLAVALEAEGATYAEVLAHHTLLAGRPDEALAHLLRAAREAIEALAFERGSRLFARALALASAGSGSGLDEEAMRAIRMEYGDALTDAGRGAEAAREYLEAASGATPAEALELERRAAEQLLRGGLIDEGLEVVERVLGHFSEKMARSPKAVLASMLWRRAQVRMRGLDFVPKAESEIPAEVLTRLDAYWSVASGLAIVDTIRGADVQARGLLHSLRVGEPFRVARALASEATLAAAGARPASEKRTAQLLARAEAVAAEVDRPDLNARLSFMRGMTAFLFGEFPRNLEELDRAYRELCLVEGETWTRQTAQLYSLVALIYLGDMLELRRRLTPMLREARERGDRYATTFLCTSMPSHAWLATDEPEEGRRRANEAFASWSREGFTLQRYWNLFTNVQADLYQGLGEEAFDRLEGSWKALSRSLILELRFVRIEALFLRARAALMAASGADDKARLRRAMKCAKAMEGERAPWGDALAKLVRGGVARARGEAEAAALYAQASQLCAEASMSLLAAAAGWRAAEAREDADGVAAARAVLAEQVKRPEAWLRLLAP